MTIRTAYAGSGFILGIQGRLGNSPPCRAVGSPAKG